MTRAEHQETPDSHDLGKLTKWHEGLASATGSDFPVCALFLASGEDIRAHNIFRVYRTSFEDLGAGFHDLVIFGQHGLSSTCAALIPGLGLSNVKIPSLVLISREQGVVFHTTALPSGSLEHGAFEDDGDDIPWRAALTAIEKSAMENTPLSLDGISGLDRVEFLGETRGETHGETLIETVGEVKKQVEETTVI